MTKLQIEDLGKLVGEMSDANLTFDADEILETGQELFAEVCRLSDKLIKQGESLDKQTLDILAKWNRLLVRIDTKLLNEIDNEQTPEIFQTPIGSGRGRSVGAD